MAKKDDGIVNLHGKEYLTVARRVNDFREEHKQAYSVETEILSDGEYVIIKATIRDTKTSVVVATGHAEEKRNSTNINKTSALENCETSAIGRALASFGMGGTEFASANEVQNAITNQNNGEQWQQPVLKFDDYKKEMEATKSINEVKAVAKKYNRPIQDKVWSQKDIDEAELLYHARSDEFVMSE